MSLFYECTCGFRIEISGLIKNKVALQGMAESAARMHEKKKCGRKPVLTKSQAHMESLRNPLLRK
jgi:hypothetical protein